MIIVTETGHNGKSKILDLSQEQAVKGKSFNACSGDNYPRRAFLHLAKMFPFFIYSGQEVRENLYTDRKKKRTEGFNPSLFKTKRFGHPYTLRLGSHY